MSVGHSCPSGYTYTNGQCRSTVTTGVQYSCPSGYTRSGTQCKKTTTQTQARPTYCNTTQYKSGIYECRFQAKVGESCQFRCTPDHYGGNGNPTPYTATRDTSFGSCPSGWTASGSQCKKTTTSTINATKYCTGGYTLSGNTCVKTITSSPTKVCESGWELNSNQTYCVKQPPTMEVIYTCPTQYPNFSPEDVNCKANVTSPTDRFETPATPTCESGYNFNASSGKCVAESLTPTLECPAGGSLSGNSCQIPKQTECKNQNGYVTNITTSTRASCERAPQTTYTSAGQRIYSSDIFRHLMMWFLCAKAISRTTLTFQRLFKLVKPLVEQDRVSLSVVTMNTLRGFAEQAIPNPTQQVRFARRVTHLALTKQFA